MVRQAEWSGRQVQSPEKDKCQNRRTRKRRIAKSRRTGKRWLTWKHTDETDQGVTVNRRPYFLCFKIALEMGSTMKQGHISMIPKPDKDPSLNVDYKLIALVYAKRLKKGIDRLIGM